MRKWISTPLRLGNLSKCQSNNETCFVDFRTCCTGARSTMKSYRRWTGWNRWCQKWWENLPMASVDPSFIFFLIKPVSSQAAQLGIQLIIQYVNFIVVLLKSNFLYISILCFAVSEPHCQARAKWRWNPDFKSRLDPKETMFVNHDSQFLLKVILRFWNANTLMN